MSDQVWLAEEFEAHREHLRAVALRMLGSSSEADDAVQEAWVRLSRSDATQIESLGAWLTTVVSRVSLDMLRSRASRREAPDASGVETATGAPSPEDEVLMSEMVGSALLVVLDTLTPAERLAFVLHDLFAVPFEEIAEMLGRSVPATKMLASRARRKVQGSDASGEVDRSRQRVVVDAFLAAAHAGEFEALLALLDPGIVLEADATGVKMGSPAIVRGASDVAAVFSGRAEAARAAFVDDGVGLVWFVGGKPKVVWEFMVGDDQVVHIDMVASAARLAEMQIEGVDG
ncbi:MAG TPA: sigma-70 family RNA polymerase sigma factor [Acidimicrobiia bacterium]|nr:sigma-70 family RNA polymerase sigma factor [Acidimicrobiia bacterium]